MNACHSTLGQPTQDRPGALAWRCPVSRSTYRNTPALARRYTWLVLVGSDCQEHWVDSVNMPSEETVRHQLRLGRSVDILIGRP